MFKTSASLCIASPNFCNESNVEPGKPTIICIAFKFDNHNSFKSITFVLSITELVLAIMTDALLILSAIYYSIDNISYELVYFINKLIFD
jgi:hypothetical protein